MNTASAIITGMTDAPTAADEIYQKHILQGVSRTFALTIPQLPDELRRPVGNAYLLCRIADTIEDDNALDSEQTRQFSREFTEVVAGNASAEELSKNLTPLLSQQSLPAEHDLIAHIPAVIRITHDFNPNQRRALERCIRIMAEGMADYQDTETLDGLPDLPAMDKYCYYVAGVVGEMLTELFCDYSEAINQNREQMMKLAVSFGQGLQMTNILKDIWDDRQRGACWLPRDIFTAHQVELADIMPGQAEPGFEKALGTLVGVAKDHLRDALEYTLLIPSREVGIRRFCLWALGMAVLTLNKINRHRNFQTGREVKITRRSVRGTVALTSLFARHDRVLRSLFNFWTRDLPTTDIREKLSNLGCTAI